MVFNLPFLAATALTFAAFGSSHMMITKPVPYGKDTLTTSPLVDTEPNSATSNYPCQQRPGVYDISEMNHMAVGEPQELTFTGSASHGGGTCQLTMTKDKEPTANSTFKIFQVFEGGCPIDSDGNSGSHPFTFVLPKGMPNGVMTFAWYWYNRIGDRELYMNCAPVTVTGGADDDTFFNSLPNVYLINMPTETCQDTFEGAQNAVTIPHPGQYILKEAAGQEIHAAVGTGCAAAAAKQLEGVVGYKSAVVTDNGAAYMFPSGAKPVPAGPSGSGAPSGGPSGAPSGAPSAVPSGSAAASAPAASGSAAASGSPAPSAPPSASASANASAPPAPSGAASGGATSAPAPSASAPVASAAPGAPSGAAASSSSGPSAAVSSGSAPSGSASCSDSGGAMKCSSDGTEFGVCADGKMVWRKVAAGTKCTNGEIEKRDVASGRLPSGPAQPRSASCSPGTRKCSSDGEEVGVCKHGKIVWKKVAPGTLCTDEQIEKRNVVSGDVLSSPAQPRSASCSRGTRKCSSDGEEVGVCKHGKIVWQKTAPGTLCTNGKIKKRDVVSYPRVRRQGRWSGRYLFG